MIKTLTILLCCLISIKGYTQINATAENGKYVILFENGTWEYKNDSVTEAPIIPLNQSEFKKNTNATFLLKSKNMNVGVYLDKNKWIYKDGGKEEAMEYMLRLTDGNVFAMLITEKISVSFDALREAVLLNAKNISTDLKVIKEEYRVVNGIKVLMMQINCTVSGTPYAYYSYCYYNEKGTVQLITYTSQQLMPSKKTACEDLLNGLVELK